MSQSLTTCKHGITWKEKEMSFGLHSGRLTWNVGGQLRMNSNVACIIDNVINWHKCSGSHAIQFDTDFGYK